MSLGCRHRCPMNRWTPIQPGEGKVALEPMLQTQLIGQDPEGYLRMARTYYRWSKQLYQKLAVDHPEVLPAPKTPRPVRIQIRITARSDRPRTPRSPGR